MEDRNTFDKDFQQAPEMLVICRREDGSIAIHTFGIESDEKACVLALEAFSYNIRPLFSKNGPVAVYTASRPEQTT